MSLSYKHGDLFAGGEEAIAHGVNCRGVMGSGIAVGFRQRYPDMYESYRIICDKNQLQLGGVIPWGQGDAKPGLCPLVYNLATQVDPGPNASYHGIMVAVDKMLGELDRCGIHQVGIPQIGCGIGGLEWPQVEGILLALTEKYPDVDVVVYVYP